MDDKNVVFGQVINGFEIIHQLENLLVDKKFRPIQDVKVVKCGELVKIVKEKKKKRDKKEKGKMLITVDFTWNYF